MPPKKEDNVKVLKGQEAEDLVLKYMRDVNRPYGAMDITANLKGAVAKTHVQKILVALSDKGLLTQKVVGKSSFYVAPQGELEEVPKDQLAEMEAECKKLDGETKAIQLELKQLQSELAKIKSEPTDKELVTIQSDLDKEVQDLIARLEPLRGGVRLISTEELAQIDAEWTKWRAEWITRRKIGKDVWATLTESMSPQDAFELAESLGFEGDSEEHELLEKGSLCQPKKSGVLKRGYGR